MGDIDDRDAEIVAQRLEQVDDGHPQRRIDHRYRLIGNDQLRFGEQRAGNGDPLKLPAGKFMRITVAHFLQRQSDLAQALHRRPSSMRVLLARGQETGAVS